MDSLLALAKVAAAYGEPQKVMEVISAYGALKDIQSEISKAGSQLRDLNEKRVRVEQQLEKTRARVSELEEPLQAYQKASKLGFRERELVTLAGLAEKYGGAELVVQAVSSYTDHAEILREVEKAKLEFANLQRQIAETETKYSHIKTAVELCDRLVAKYKFGFDAIATIFTLAEKYGKPMNVLKAVEAFGALGPMTEKLSSLQGQVQEKGKMLHELEGKNEAALQQVDALAARCMKVGAEVSQVETRVENGKYLQMLMDFVSEPTKASYNDSVSFVIALATSLLKWFGANERHFRNPYTLKSGLEGLMRELGA